MRSAFTIILIFITTFTLHAQSGYKMVFTVEGVKDTMIFLANHYGDKQYIKDSARINSKGVVTFEGKTPLQRGMYLLVMPDHSYFEFLVNDDQHFSLSTKKDNMVGAMKVKDSKENEVFFKDLNYIGDKRKEYEQLKALLDEIKSAPDKMENQEEAIAELEKKMKAIDEDVKSHRKKLVQDNPDLFYAKFIKALEEPVIPDNPNPSDSFFAYRYYKAHFFDNLDFTDDRFVYSPVFHQKLSKYLQQLVMQDKDSIILEADMLLAKTRNTPELFKYTLAYLLNEHAGSKVMGMDAVYVHLVDNYYAKGDADWIDPKQLEKIKEDAAKLRPLLIGKKVPNIVMKDEKGVWRSLNDVKAKYTVLYFWDADCGHCRTETPKLHELYKKLRSEGVDIEVYAVSIELVRNHWDTFLKENNLDWINVIDIEGQSNYRSFYKIESTPQVYLLDENKVIIGKRIDVENLEAILRHLVKDPVK